MKSIHSAMHPETIAVVLIGDELLSGQIQDKNLKYAIQQFAVTGHRLSEARIIGDDQSQIAETVRDMSARHGYVITSGGVGPTHDDCTVCGIADALHETTVRNPVLEASLRAYYGDAITDDALRMADVPESAELLDESGHNWPIVRARNIFILPGVPQIFQQKFDRLIRYLPNATPFFQSALFVNWDEVYFAEQLRVLNAEIEDLMIGSYPIFGHPQYNTQITLKHTNAETLKIAHQRVRVFFEAEQRLIMESEVKPFRSGT